VTSPKESVGIDETLEKSCETRHDETHSEGEDSDGPERVQIFREHEVEMTLLDPRFKYYNWWQTRKYV
jgi:hypothetical protein